jgi:hypothetical protein
MFEFRLNLTIDVDQTANALTIQTPVPLQLHYRGGRWTAEAQNPPVTTPLFDKMDEAIVAGARAATLELQSLVTDRPVVAGRITPADVPVGWF